MCCIITETALRDIIKDDREGVKLYRKILEQVPVGFKWHRKGIDYGKFSSASGDKDLNKRIETRLEPQYGTLGGGK